MVIDRVLNEDFLNKEGLLYLMELEDPEEIEKLYNKAYNIKKEYVGAKLYYRGLIEFSNLCFKDCNYCGIRRSNKNIKHYAMTKEEILDSVQWLYDNNYGSIALQSGERQDSHFVDFVEEILDEIKKKYNDKLGITISLGEQSYETYKRWFDAGSHRYLLRIETSNETLYNSLHPNDEMHNYKKRIQALDDLKKIGYQVGTGVMIGLPNQKPKDLVNDILFYKEKDIDMIGMGPYILHSETPMGKNFKNSIFSADKRVELTLKMIAISRLYLKDVNIAATTALQGLDPFGREKGILAGANILMPIVTKDEYRAKYQLYNNKPCIDDNAEKCKKCLEQRIKSTGDKIVYGERGDAPHYFKRIKKMENKL